MKEAKRVQETGIYYIKDVARITGLSEQVIRKWEDRYGIVCPARKGNGYRVYGEEEISRLLKMKALRNEGHPLKQAAEMAVCSHVGGEGAESRNEATSYIHLLTANGEKCDEAELERILQQAHSELGLERFLDEVIIPFLKQVGSFWERGEWKEYQESVSSLVIRDLLVNIRRSIRPAPGAPLIIGACFPGERHEIPVHFILLKAMLKGCRTHLIGASPAPGAIESIVQQLRPDAVLLSASTTAPFLLNPGVMEDLDRFAAEQTETLFYAGGTGAVLAAAAAQPKAVRVTDDLDAVIRELKGRHLG